MAALLSAQAFRDALTNEGVVTIGLPGWENHNRDAGHTPLSPNGVVIHHTGSDTSDPQFYAQTVLWGGYAALPGPLCHAGGAPNGDLILTGHGRANHAGGGDQASLNAVIADAAPLSGELHPHFGNSNGVDGNSHFYGLEIMYSGGHPMTPQQYNSAVRFATALCRAHGWTAGSVIGHKEWSSDKVDPGQCPMDAFRRDVAAALALPAGRWRADGLPPAPAPTPPAPPAAWDGHSFPGRLVIGQTSSAVTLLGERLVAHGYGRFYSVGPGPTMGQADVNATRQFQLDQGWTGSGADGYLGPQTWDRLMAGVAPAPAPAPAPAHPTVNLEHLRASIIVDGPKPTGYASNKGNTLPVEQALVAEGLLPAAMADGSAGTSTFGQGSAYQKLQLRYGYTGKDADGIPGMASLTKLGQAHGFSVVER